MGEEGGGEGGKEGKGRKGVNGGEGGGKGGIGSTEWVEGVFVRVFVWNGWGRGWGCGVVRSDFWGDRSLFLCRRFFFFGEFTFVCFFQRVVQFTAHL